jgi:phosphatidylserine synthase
LQTLMMKLNNNLCKTMNYLELHKEHSWNNTLEIIGLKFEGIENIKFYFFAKMHMQTSLLETLHIWKIVKIEFGGLIFFHIYLFHYHFTFYLFNLIFTIILCVYFWICIIWQQLHKWRHLGFVL